MIADPAVPDVEQGLTSSEVAQRRADGRGNDVAHRTSRSLGEIVKANVFTRFNAILGVLLLIVLSTGSWIDGMFGLVIVVNSVVGIVQEARAKQMLDKLSIVGQAKPRVRRDGATVEVVPSDIVADDIIEMGAGDQIVVDGEVLVAASMEVDESLLTGESDPVVKERGDEVLSGSFVASGSGLYRATKVGAEAYAAKLAAEAGKFTLVDSELRNGVNTILKYITWLMIPAGVLSIYNQLRGNTDLPRALRGMVAALVPMVPEGLILMMSVAFAVGVIRLGRRQCLVNELPAIEGLARVDVVCADKTGTLTENAMRLGEIQALDQSGEKARAEEALAALAAADPRPNASLAAIGEAFPHDPGWHPVADAPFSSARKWSGTSFNVDGGVQHWVLGAPDVLLPDGNADRTEAERIGAEGRRVLLLGSSDRSVDAYDAPGVVTPVALVVLDQKIRPDAKDALDYFARQDVAVKVISGDNAVSVGAVAQTLGLPNSTDPVDARTLPTEQHQLAETVEGAGVFGRVTPAQKRAMVSALQSTGHAVAMTGDGVNDVLALKDSDIGVAMGSGSPAARSVAQIVLLDNKFATLPYVVAEGRRVIGNIERVSTLFLTKTVYSVLLALLIGIPGLIGFTALPYPFLPRHVTIVGWFTIGLPAFILSLAPNTDRARRGFVSRVLRFAVPAGIAVASATFVAYVVAGHGRNLSGEDQVEVSTTALIVLMAVALWVLGIVMRPFVWWKVGLFAVMVGASILMFVIPLTKRVFELDPGGFGKLGTAIACAAAGIAVIEVIWRIDGRLRGEPRRIW